GLGYGGGLMNQGTATVTNSAFTDNQATGGGAPAFAGAGLGGGIASFGPNPSLTVTGCTFTNNAAIDGAGFLAAGGGVFTVGGTLTLSNSTFTGNQAVGTATAAFGGGLGNLRATVSVSNCTFTGNMARGYRFSQSGAFETDLGPATVS